MNTGRIRGNKFSCIHKLAGVGEKVVQEEMGEFFDVRSPSTIVNNNDEKTHSFLMNHVSSQSKDDILEPVDIPREAMAD